MFESTNFDGLDEVYKKKNYSSLNRIGLMSNSPYEPEMIILTILDS